MSAENAWRIAREAAAKVCPRDADPYGCSSDYAIGYESGSQAAADDVLSLPMPPAFRAAVEAEMGEVVIRAAVAEYLLRHPNEGADERLGRAAAARGIMVRLGLYSEFEQALDYAAFQSAESRDKGGLCSDCPPQGYPTNETRCEECPRRALLSRLEAKGESHDAG